MQQIIPLAKLQKGREKNGVLVRVVRKWSLRENTDQANIRYVGLVFSDAKGDPMYAEIPQETVPAKEYLFQPGMVYIVKKFRVTNMRPFYRPFPASLMIELTDFTTVEPVERPPSSIPQYVYNLTPFSALVPATGAVFAYTDVIGYVVRYGAASTFVPKNKERATTLRELYLKDLKDDELKITLWGEHATNFNIDSVYDAASGNLIVCLIVGCIPRRSYGDYNKCYLSGSAACCYYFNPQITEAAAYHTRFKNCPVFIDRPAETENIAKTMVQTRPLQQKTIAELDSIDPFDFEDGTYKCAVTIISIPTNTSWWYMSCQPCKKKAEQQPDHTYKCPKCLGYNVIPRFSLSFIGQDETGDASFFAFDEEARQIVQRDCDAIMNPIALSSGLPQPLQRIIGKTYTFGIDLTDTSCASYMKRQYIVKSVLERPRRQNVAADAGAQGAVQILQGESAKHTEVATIAAHQSQNIAAVAGAKTVSQAFQQESSKHTDIPRVTAHEIGSSDYEHDLQDVPTENSKLVQSPAPVHSYERGSSLPAVEQSKQTPPDPLLAKSLLSKQTAPSSVLGPTKARRSLFADASSPVEPQKNTVPTKEVGLNADEPEVEHGTKRKRKAETAVDSQTETST